MFTRVNQRAQEVFSRDPKWVDLDFSGNQPMKTLQRIGPFPKRKAARLHHPDSKDGSDFQEEIVIEGGSYSGMTADG